MQSFPDGYCDASLAAAGERAYAVAATACAQDLEERLRANKIHATSSVGSSWSVIYPPGDAQNATSAQYGGEGDVRAYQDDVLYLGAPFSVTNAIVAISEDGGTSWGPLTTIQTEGFPADQPWLYLGPNLGGPESATPPYSLLAWFKGVIGGPGTLVPGAGTFSTNGGTVWAPLTPLPRAFVANLLCTGNAADAGDNIVDQRVPNDRFAGMRAGVRGGWSTEGRFYWVMISDEDIYSCFTTDHAATWNGWRYPRPAGLITGAPPLVAFDDLGTFYVMAGNKLLVSMDRGANVSYVHTVPYASDAAWTEGSPIRQWFAVKGGYVHIIQLFPEGLHCEHSVGCWGYGMGQSRHCRSELAI